MKCLLVTALLGLAALTTAGAAFADNSRPQATTVTREAYGGWEGAYHLSNGVVDLFVVPQIGRIMAFHLTGRPETDPIWRNPAFAGKPRPTDAGVWANYGGDKLWPSEQSQWPKHQPQAWPPDPVFEFGPFQVSQIRNGIRLTGPVVPNYAVQVVREIVLPPGAARVDLKDTFLKSKDAAGDKNGFPIGIWSVTQTRGDETVYVPVDLQGQFPGVGYTSLGDSGISSPNWKIADGLLEVTRDPDKATKVGADDAAGWMACLYGGNVLFSEHFTRAPKGVYPDKNTNAQVYTNPGADAPYIEVEVLGPMANLKAGQKLTRTMHWQLQQLPRTPSDPADARALVKAAMK